MGIEVNASAPSFEKLVAEEAATVLAEAPPEVITQLVKSALPVGRASVGPVAPIAPQTCNDTLPLDQNTARHIALLAELRSIKKEDVAHLSPEQKEEFIRLATQYLEDSETVGSEGYDPAKLSAMEALLRTVKAPPPMKEADAFAALEKHKDKLPSVFDIDKVGEMAKDDNLPEELQKALKFLADNPESAKKLDTLAKGGQEDGKIGHNDLQVAALGHQIDSDKALETILQHRDKLGRGFHIDKAGEKALDESLPLELRQALAHIRTHKPEFAGDLDNMAFGGKKDGYIARVDMRTADMGSQMDSDKALDVLVEHRDKLGKGFSIEKAGVKAMDESLPMELRQALAHLRTNPELAEKIDGMGDENGWISKRELRAAGESKKVDEALDQLDSVLNDEPRPVCGTGLPTRPRLSNQEVKERIELIKELVTLEGQLDSIASGQAAGGTAQGPAPLIGPADAGSVGVAPAITTLPGPGGPGKVEANPGAPVDSAAASNVAVRGSAPDTATDTVRPAADPGRPAAPAQTDAATPTEGAVEDPEWAEMRKTLAALKKKVADLEAKFGGGQPAADPTGGQQGAQAAATSPSYQPPMQFGQYAPITGQSVANALFDQHIRSMAPVFNFGWGMFDNIIRGMQGDLTNRTY